MSGRCPYQLQRRLLEKDRYTDIFCSNCLRHERFFTGGHSWTPDLCPCGCEDTVVWYKMTTIQKIKAKKKYKDDLKEWQKNL